LIGETLKSILTQSFSNFEIIVNDDASTDETEKVVNSFNDPRIKFFRNDENLGYPQNLEKTRQHAQGEILFLMGQDDILAKDALKNIQKAFEMSPEIGAVTRPYFWFDAKIERPVRAKGQMNPAADEIVRITDKPERVDLVFQTLDQLSGLAYRKEFFDRPFHADVFTSHIHPFASIFKKHPIVFLKDYSVAVRISSSQSRKVSSIYEKSPMQSWAEMFETVFPEEKFAQLRKHLILNFVAKNYVGLVQIRNYAKYRYLWREIFLLLKYRWQNIFSFQFWFFSLGCIVMPPALLIPLGDWYKEKINSRIIKKIKFDY
jgi:glycosyltransferase involved in cell wall biosynthesis